MSFESIVLYMVALVYLKNVLLGSEFSFYYWFKHGLLYAHWYNNRQTFKQWLETDANKLTPVE